MRLAFLFALSTTLLACTETPGNFPPCVDPYTPCAASEAGADASDGGPADAPSEAMTVDAPGETTGDAAAAATADAH